MDKKSAFVEVGPASLFSAAGTFSCIPDTHKLIERVWLSLQHVPSTKVISGGTAVVSR